MTVIKTIVPAFLSSYFSSILMELSPAKQAADLNVVTGVKLHVRKAAPKAATLARG